MIRSNIYIFTSSFPYGKMAETFLEDEIKIAADCANITILPLCKGDGMRQIPKNVKISNILNEIGVLDKIFVFLKLIFSVTFIKFIKNYNFSIIDISKGIKYLYGSFLVEYVLLKHHDDFADSGIFYSYWFNHTPFGLALSKKHIKQFSNFKIITRAHGYDLYERERGVIIPFRELTLSMIDKVYVISDYGVKYLSKKFPQYKERITLSRLGVPLYLTNNKTINLATRGEMDSIKIVSCSSVNHIKRVDLIFKSLYDFSLNSALNVQWTHLGDGPLFNDLKSKVVSTSNDKLKVNLVGYIPKKDIQSYYANNNFDVFVNLSITEGIPVSIMEAISDGIPALATNVGATSEIVNEEVGLLLHRNFTQLEFDTALSNILKNIDNYRISSYDFFIRNYLADDNYKSFYQQLLS